jgi:hypothetical protein
MTSRLPFKKIFGTNKKFAGSEQNYRQITDALINIITDNPFWQIYSDSVRYSQGCTQENGHQIKNNCEQVSSNCQIITNKIALYGEAINVKNQVEKFTVLCNLTSWRVYGQQRDKLVLYH